MKTNSNIETAADASVVAAGFEDLLGSLTDRIAGCFARSEPRRLAVAAIRALVGMSTSRNGWSIAEHIGQGSPDGVQRLLNKASWDAEEVLRQVRGLVLGRQAGLADPAAVLAIDETGDQKKGGATVGVQRQYSGTCGRVENCQVIVCASYITGRAHTLIDARLYLPASWCEDPARMALAAIPEQEQQFATKPTIARGIVQTALREQVAFGWVAADEVYGADPRLRHLLREHRKRYVLAVACNHQVATPEGKTRVEQLVAKLPRRAWNRLSAGNGTKGRRLYDWALLNPQQEPDQILARRSRTTGEIAYYRAWSAKTRTPLATLVKVAGSRWPIETDFQTTKNECGLDEHQVRTWTAHRRWLVLTIAAHALLTITQLQAHRNHETSAPPTEPANDMIPLTIPEIRRLLQALILNPTTDLDHTLRWSRWRRHRQAQARRCHYQQQELTQ